MNITHQLQKIRILFTHDRFVPVLEYMPHPLVSPIKPYRITCVRGDILYCFCQEKK